MIVVVLISSLVAIAAAIYVATPLARGGRAPALACALLIAMGALGIYLVNGEPDAPGQPYSVLVDRLRTADPMSLSAIEQEERLRDALRTNPEDAQALALLGRYLSRTERELEAVALFERALRIEETARIYSDLGQALLNLNEGALTAQARTAFGQAARLDPTMPEPAFFLGVAAFEDGDRNEAARRWADIIEQLDPDDPFRQAIAARAGDLLSRPAGGPDSEGAAPFAEAAAEGADMDAMIAAMVDGLQARVEADPEDLAGWLALARARRMQDQPDDARAALTAARDQFADGAGEIVIIAAVERALQLEESDA
jgi:cytochrome c-type biogenesis protein CcmH